MQLDYLYGINPVKEGLRGRRRPVELFVDEQAGGRRIDEILAAGLHAFLTQFLDRINELGARISNDFLMPS